jgi:uncharacterized protein YfaS (alpha-2-macroglobulin family)
MRNKKVVPVILGILTIFACLAGVMGCLQSSVFDPSFEMRVLGNSSFLAGSHGALRVITFDPATKNPVGGVPVKIYMDRKGAAAQPKAPDAGGSTPGPGAAKNYGEQVFSGRTDDTGSLNAAFGIPDDWEGSALMTVVGGMTAKATEVETNVNFTKKSKIYLTTDKPLYQPGQVINIRALALRVPSLKPMAEQDVLLEVQDAKGNKVFKQKGKTSAYGIAFAKFQLADEVNMGEYRVTVFVGPENAEKTVTVKRYVLPKFKVGFDKDRKFYKPGDTLKGEVQADYFFGKPVAGGKVKATLHTFDVEFKPAAEVQGTTDAKGHYSFEMKLPDFLVGQPLEKGKAMTRLDIEVTDTADHKETAIRMLPVSGQSMAVQMIPEAGTLKEGLDNVVYVMATYPDGSPAKASLNLTYLDQSRIITTDEAGLATFNVKPPAGGVSVNVQASTPQGDSLATSAYLPVTGGEENIILRTDKAQYHVGQLISIDILSTKGGGVAYLDIIKDRQAILTKAVKMAGSHHNLLLETSPGMTGMLSLHLYRITDKNQIIRDTRNIFVKSADDLTIEVKPDKDVYKPGEEGKINFVIKDKTGIPAQAAIGVDIVDEAVFAMGEMMPGLEKIYFLLEKQLMEPTYEIHGMTVADAVLTPEQAADDQQTVKKVLFAKIPVETGFTIDVNTFNRKLESCYQKMQRIHNAVNAYYAKNRTWPGPGDLDTLVREDFLKPDDVKDPWGNRFFLTTPAGDNKYPDILCSGPSGIVGDKDDILYSKLMSEYWQLGREEGGEMRDGDFVGRRVRSMKMDGMPLPPAAAIPEMAKNEAAEKKGLAGTKEQAQGGKAVRVREYFPETLYTNPQIITDERGQAQIGLTMADSITTWRLSAFANSAKGLMGNTTGGIKVFQDFFIDIDFPVALTKGDEVSVPIAVYNYLKEGQSVKLTVEKEDWFQLQGGAEKSLEIKAGEVDVAYFRIKTAKIGTHKLTVKAQGTKFSDAIKREIRVLPDGKEFNVSKSDRLSGKVSNTVQIPAGAVPDASKIMVRVYPGVVSQVIEGMEKIMRMPGGCFEQTTSTTYPNVLVLDYLTRQKKITPELQMTAEGYINTGYQRLVSFEVQGGGFSWFGNAPANQCLTALGLLQFRDMSKVHSVDENVIARTQAWLASQQAQDGSWAPDQNYLHADTWSKMQGGGKVPVTAYIVWALAESGYKGEDLSRGLAYLKSNAAQLEDPYILALTCNAMAQLDPKGKETKEMLEKLRKKAIHGKEDVHWSTGIQTTTYTHGNGADVETTALATLAFLKVDGYEELATKGVNYLVRSKDSFGTWSTTQTTVLAMKALLLAQDRATSKLNAKVRITVNGKGEKVFEVNSDNYDVYMQADFGDVTKNGPNVIDISVEGQGSCYYQISTRYFMPWGRDALGVKPLAIDVAYDRTSLKTDEMITSAITVKNNTKAAMKMVMIDLGIPPGFTVMAPDLDEHVGKKFVKYTLTPRQIIIYTETIKPAEVIKFKYRLKAKYPLRAKTPDSKAYQYYNPEVQDVSRPVTLEVK